LSETTAIESVSRPDENRVARKLAGRLATQKTNLQRRLLRRCITAASARHPPLALHLTTAKNIALRGEQTQRLFNAYYGIDKVKRVDGATWRLELAGAIENKQPWTRRRLEPALVQRSRIQPMSSARPKRHSEVASARKLQVTRIYGRASPCSALRFQRPNIRRYQKTSCARRRCPVHAHRLRDRVRVPGIHASRIPCHRP